MDDNRAMKALTVRRPWTQLIVLGAKDVENRSWTVAYRGPVAINAGQRWEPEGVALARRLYPGRADPVWEASLQRDEAATGYIGMIDLVDVCRAAIDGRRCRCGPWAAAGHYHWRLARARAFDEAIAGPGFLGLRDAPDHVADVFAGAMDTAGNRLSHDRRH